jgi:UDP-glucose 4-epimerase
MRVLVTGGAGYVGSVSVERLLAAGHTVTVLDSMVKGHRAAVPAGARLVVGEVGDHELVEATLRDDQVDSVLHCAGFSLVPESMVEPELYFDANVRDGVVLLDAIHAAGVRRVVFSSTASIYGTPARVPVEEGDALAPINTYGATKLAFEMALAAYSRAYGWGSVALRYFNVAGATASFGEDHRPESHLIPNILTAAVTGKPVSLFGTDYPTPDGTCIRDYIHVGDLADAHLAALELTADLEPSMLACNLGTATGFSVREVFETAQSVVGRPIAHAWGPRRGTGDPPTLVASNARAVDVLGWRPARGALVEIIGSAWRWRQAHPNGYSDGAPES